MKNENSTKKSNRKYYAAAIIGALAIVAVSWAIINQNNSVKDEEHIDLNDGAGDLGSDIAKGNDEGSDLGGSIDQNIDFSELYPERDNTGFDTADAGDTTNPPVTDSQKDNTAGPNHDKGIALSDNGGAQKGQDDKTNTSEPEKSDVEKTETPDNTDLAEVSSNDVQQQADSLEASVAGLSFSADSGLRWPVKGNVILNYSDDHVIYHATLNQFRTNPAILIGCEAGQEVVAAASGIITGIVETPQTGITVTTAIGDGYSLVYGQLETSDLKVGDYVEAGSTIGKVAKVSRFYTVEGDNLYFQVMKDDKTMNPMMLIKDEQ